MKIYAAFPDTLNNSMAIHDMPVDALTAAGVHCEKQEQFFATTIYEVKEDDLVILWIGSKDENRLNAFSNLKCRKVLRNVDSCSSDRVFFKRELELYERLGLECIFVTYCTDWSMEFLAKHKINAIKYPHLLDFEKFGRIDAEKKFDVFISGHLSEKSYPLRNKLASFFSKRQHKYNICYLPHPGYRLNNMVHHVYGKKYIDLASTAYLSIVCSGDIDALYAKYVEFAAALSLPLGDSPSNMPLEASKQMINVSKEMSEEQLEKIIDLALSDKVALQEKTIAYRNSMQENFGIEKTKSFIEKAVNRLYDNSNLAV